MALRGEDRPDRDFSGLHPSLQRVQNNVTEQFLLTKPSDFTSLLESPASKAALFHITKVDGKEWLDHFSKYLLGLEQHCK